MKTGFMKQVNELIRQSDLVIEVLDARHPEKTRNKFLEKNVKGNGKKLLLVINKSDLIPKEQAEKEKEGLSKKARVVFISALKKDGINLIRKEISYFGKEKKDFTVGIIGYPNVGKSTLINALAGKGRGRVATSRKAGLTRGITKVKVSDGYYLVDSPGIIPRNEKEYELFLVESKNPNQLKDIEGTAVKLIQEIGTKKIAEAYGLEEKELEGKDEEEILEEIAHKKRYLMTGGKADSMRAARELLEKYQRHELI